jgi:hypothetical protein
MPGRGRVLIVLFILILTLSTVSNATQEFAPKLFTEMGFSPSYVGWLSGIRMLASAIGILAGGHVGGSPGGSLARFSRWGHWISALHFVYSGSPNHGVLCYWHWPGLAPGCPTAS